MTQYIVLLLASIAVTPAVRQPQIILPEAANEHFRAGMRALAAEQYDKAEAEFRNAVEIDPLFHAAFYGLGQVYMATRRYDVAVKAYLNSRDAFKKGIAAEQTDAVAADRRRRDELQAKKEYLRTLERRSTTQSPGLASAIDRARDDVRQLEASLNRTKGDPPPPVPAGLSMALGSAYFRTRDLEGAEREYLEAVRVDPKFGEAHNNLAVVYMLMGRLDQADLEIALAEKAGFKVSPQLKSDLKSRRGK
jgi:tetratricopeptide (TPR) repeat protein